MYSQGLISEICSRNDIVDYVSRYVRLKKSGRGYTGLCPFHNEKTPSFHVSPDKQLFHCFGCGAGGNLIQFVMRIEGLDFRDALKTLADRAGMALPEDDGYDNDAAILKKKKIYAMNKAAARFFYDTLTKTPAGREGLKYFAARRIKAETINIYGLGFAPESYDMLFSHMREQGYTQEELLEAGLISQNEKGSVYDRFRGRVMFPIIDVRGNVIGFGGRILDDSPRADGFKPPKYLNSAQTPVFDKGRNLFSLNLAKNAPGRELILVEGYMDVISVYQAGVKNIVATLGTALTEQQVRLLNRYSDEILICYDSDEAGVKAALRAIDLIGSVGGRSRVIRLRGAKDPDEYIKANGVEAFREAVSKSVPGTEFKLMQVKGKYNIESTDGKVKFISEAADALSTVNDAVEVDAYISRMAQETGIGREAIYSEYKKKTARNRLFRPNEEAGRIRRTEVPKAEAYSGERKGSIETELGILRLAAEEKRIYKIVKEQLSPQDFDSDAARLIAEEIYKSWDGGQRPEPAVILAKFQTDGRGAADAAGAFIDPVRYDDNETAVKQLIRAMKMDKVSAQIAEEEKKGNSMDIMRMAQLHKEYEKLKRQQ